MAKQNSAKRKLSIAAESEKTKKAREKLNKKYNLIDEKITPKALEQKSVEIQKWIARHAERRIALKDKSISLFDENKNAADVSFRVAKLAKKLSKDFSSE